MDNKKLSKKIKKLNKRLKKQRKREAKSQSVRHCFDCGVTGVEFHKHHVVPKSKGGGATVDLCLDCHGKAHGRKISSSQLVKDAIAKVIEAGGKWGGDAEHMAMMRQISHKVRRQKLLEFLSRLMQAVAFIRYTHKGPGRITQRQIVERLNAMNFKTPKGKDWTRSYYALCLLKIRECKKEIQQLEDLRYPEEEL